MAGIEWGQADIQELPFGDGSFDAVVCQFGFMFVPDKVLGFRECHRVLAPRGVLLGNVWKSLDENSQVRVVNDTLASLFPDDPPRFFDTPYGYAPDRVRADLEQAGWEDMGLEDVRLDGTSPSAADYVLGFSRGSPLTHELLERGADIDAVVRSLAEALGDRAPLHVEQTALVIVARR
jgi:SAM-dependent methyltransferase